MQKEPQQAYWYMIPSVLVEKGGNMTKAMLYGLVTSLCSNKGYCYASNEYLTKKLHRKNNSIITKYLGELAKEGWIRLDIDMTRKIWRRIYLTVTPPKYSSTEKTVEGFNEKTVETSTEKTVDTKSNKRESNKKRVIAKANFNSEKKIPPPLKSSLLDMTSNEDDTPERKKIVKPKLGSPDELAFFQIYKREIYPLARANMKSVIAGIPRAIQTFNKEFGEKDGLKKLNESLLVFKERNYNYYIENIPQALSAHTFFSQKFIDDKLLPLTLTNNKKKYESVYTDEMSEEELREEQKTLARELEQNFPSST